MLGVYYPPTPRPDTPILVFSYGGGFYIGARMLPAPASIIYHNLGSFFATRGFITVIPDYRLWVVDNLPFPDSDIYVLGHSAGAMNMFTILALPELYSPTLQPRIKGAVLLSGLYTFEDMPADMKDSVRLYYGEDDEAKQRVPLALDIPCLYPTMEKLCAALKAGNVSYDEFVARGHNHVSLVFALGTGQGEEWAEDVVKWVHACSDSEP
ncbi:Alpha/Beta hydrolase protein [Desarmillaria tabescens]|uniref:Alpha/Beta hydrolase protein n=1 Tax=Armillaria tabescens TaxID=1929756 RepID=A0AA39K001_ARMTA|nr:Alpha/Beta hydrolase protein [Desarmillaria tabescens]KAK0452062.1 Alpha/Beta hydrolase protein [Desarmillaria tabescens]